MIRKYQIVFGLALSLGACTGNEEAPSTLSNHGGNDAGSDVANPAPVATACASIEEHPGSITFVDENSGAREDKRIAEVPAAIRFHMDGAGRTPITRITTLRKPDDRFEIAMFGPCGQALATLRGTAARNEVH